jgi:ketosteroid isomerase-like protein
VDGRLTRSTLLILLLASPTTSGGVPVLELLCEKILYERKQEFPCSWFINSSAIHRSLLQSLTRRKALHKEEDQEVFQKANYSKEYVPGQTFSGKEEINMQAQDNKAVVRRFWEEVLNSGNLDVVDELFAPEWVLCDTTRGTFHDLGFKEGENRGPEAVRDLVEIIRSTFSDLRVSVEDQMAAEADRVVTRFTVIGTPVSGTREANPVDVKGISVSEVSDGKITRSWVQWESARLYEQLGWSISPPIEPARVKRPIWDP